MYVSICKKRVKISDLIISAPFVVNILGNTSQAFNIQIILLFLFWFT